MIHPKEMKKITVIGSKHRLEPVVERLHDLEVLHIDDYTDEAGDLDIGDPQGDAEELSDLLVKLRSVRSRLPDVDETRNGNGHDLREELDDVSAAIEEIENDITEAAQAKEEKQDLLRKLNIVDRLGLSPSDFEPYESIDYYVGTVANFSFTEELDDGRYELYTDNNLMALFVDTEEAVDEPLRNAGFDAVSVDGVEKLDDNTTREKDQLQTDIEELESRRQDLLAEKKDLAQEWRGYLDTKEFDLAEDLEKAEAPLRFAVTDNAFIAEGWVPIEQYDTIVEELESATDGHIHIEEDEDANPKEAPVAHDNPEGVNYFEDLVGFYGIPSYTEVDPTFLLITFPLLFGFMLGDVGYGLTTFGVFYLLYKKFPEAEGLWKSLMYASGVTIIFGLIYGEMFGYLLFGPESDLAAVTGLELFRQLPILFHRGHELSTVMTLSLLIGVVHVNLGFLVGVYNEYIQHGVKEAILAKLSWIIIEIGVAVAAFTSLNIVGGIITIAGVVMLYFGEHIEGIVEIPSLLSNILSYLRIFGVTIAVLALARVVNVLAEPLFQSGSLFLISMGVLVLLVGHTLNTFIKMIEAGLQGIRLHYVEFFTKFFEGGGEYYRPFGGSK